MKANTYIVTAPSFFWEAPMKTEEILKNRLQRVGVAFSILLAAVVAVQMM